MILETVVSGSIPSTFRDATEELVCVLILLTYSWTTGEAPVRVCVRFGRGVLGTVLEGRALVGVDR